MRYCIIAGLFVLLVGATAACGDSTTPTQSTSTTSTQPPHLAVFMDSASGFSTSDVRDVQDHIVHFDTISNSLIWVAGGQSFAGYPVSGNFIGPDRKFQVRFGTKDGNCRGYFTETVSGTICDIELVTGQLTISPTITTVPASCLQ